MNMGWKGVSVPILLLCGVDDDGEEEDDDDDLSLSFLLVAGGALTTLIPKALARVPVNDFDCLWRVLWRVAMNRSSALLADLGSATIVIVVNCRRSSVVVNNQ
jgi:hypothetical protein